MFRRILSILVVLLAAGLSAAAQGGSQIILYNGDTVDYQLCHQNEALNFFTSSNMGAPIDAVARVWANGNVTVETILHIGYTGVPIDSSTTGYPYTDYVTVTDADSTLINSAIGFFNRTFTGRNGPIEIRVHFDSVASLQSNISRQINVLITLDNDSCTSRFWNISTGSYGLDTAVIHYSSRDTSALMSVDGGPWVTVTADYNNYRGQAVIHGLEHNMEHTVLFTTVADSANHCCYVEYNFFMPPPPIAGCIDATDLRSEYVMCSYSYWNNVRYGAIDHGWQNITSRHTIVNDTTAVDPRVGFRIVCPGCDSVVRLGNSLVGAEWEAVTYAMRVDSTQNALLILKYAAVLQNPGHEYNVQPSFSFDLFDHNMQSIPEACSHANFVAGNSLGWIDYADIQYKYWTSVGFDLSAYHGQTIYLQLKTADCTAGAHFGYAYYTAHCASKKIYLDHCGSQTPDDSNTFTAPEGFIYRWYNSADSTIGTAHSITLPNDDSTYHCQMTSPQNSECSITISIIGGTRLAVARASIDSITTTNCRDYSVTFRNESFVNGSPSEHCDEILWLFSDGDTSSEYNPTHIFHDTGSVSATLIVGLSGFACKDTTAVTVSLPRLFLRDDSLAVCDSMLWRDGVTYYYDTVGPQLSLPNPAACDSVITLVLDVNPSYIMPTVFDTTCRYAPYYWLGHPLRLPPGDSLARTDTLVTTAGCDSILSLHLHIIPTTLAATQHDTACSGASYSWRGITVTDSLPEQTLRDTVIGADGCDTVMALHLIRHPQLHIAIAEEHGCDSKEYLLMAVGDTAANLRWSNGATSTTTTASPSTPTPIWLTAGYGDRLLCAVSDSLMLRPVTIPTAMLKVVPDRLTYDHPELTASDISGQNYLRSWSIVYPDGDSIHLSSGAQQVSYTADPSADSLLVVLAVSNGLCFDTASQTVKMMYATLYAPNIFTPDREDNNRFAVVGHGINQLELEIYNRNGERIFHTTDASGGWDGSSHGRPCTQGAYVWRLVYTATDRPHDKRTALGTVTLIR